MKLETVRKTFTDWAPIYNPTHDWIPKRRVARLALDHDTLEEIQRAFKQVEVHHYWLGMIFIAVARKR